MPFPRILPCCCFVFAIAATASAQVTDPRITSWQTAKSAQYARVYESAAKFSSGTTNTTWPTSGLVTSPAGGVATAAYSDVQRVAYSASYVYIQTTGLASYTMGNWLTPTGTTYTSFPSNRAAIHRIPRNVTIPATKSKNNGNGGVLVNGVYVWQNGDAQSYANASSTASSATISMAGDGVWNRLAGVAESFNFDPANGHQPSNGAYHNHINPKALRYQLGDNVTYSSSTKTYSESATPTAHSPIIGWANDGLPIYGPYGYSTATDATSGIRRMTTGFVKRDAANAALHGTDDLAVTGRIKLPVWAASVQGKSQTLTSTQYGPTTTATYALGPTTKTCSIGLFAEDYEYLGDLGKTQGTDFDLNRQNVRYGVTPEYPDGTYAYFVCLDASGNTVFPDVINQEYFGTASAGQGTVTSITETVTEYVDAGPAAAIVLTGAASGGNVLLSWNSAEGATYKVESSADNATFTTLSSAVTSAGLTTSYTAAGSTNYYRVTLTAISTYDTGGTYGTPVGKTATLLYGTAAVAPAVTTQPGNVTVTAGASATFSVVASGTAPLSYQWYKGVSAITGATSASYVIATTVAGDAGSYSVVVTNTAGSATSGGATLTVNAATVAPAITTQPGNVSVTAGASATFSVVASGTAPLSYQWYKGVSAITGATSASYVIATTVAGDAGSYSVVVTNTAGSATSSGATLTISPASGVDPRLSSWSTGASGKYARLYESDAAKTAGTALTTWSRGTGAQSSPSYAGVMQISSSADYVYLRSSGLGYHVMGPWYLNAGHTQNFPNFPANQNVLYRVPRSPTVPSGKTLTPAGAIGYGVDGVAIFDNRDTFSYSTAGGQDAEPTNGLMGTGVWNRDAYFNESVTFDPAFAHQAGSNYHYHANTPALRYQLGDHVDYAAATKTYAESAAAVTKHSPILGWMADGFPLYGPYGYATATDATSGLRRMVSGYAKRDGTNGSTNLAATGRTTLPAWAARAQGRSATLGSTQYGPAVNTTYAIGRYLEDFDYLGELGKTQGVDFDLDLHNGRFCVTPEFPGGTYAYFVSIESDGTPKFPYLIGRWFYGTPAGGAVTSVTETVTEYVRSGPTSGLALTATTAGAGVALAWVSAEGATYKVEASSDNATWATVAATVTSGGTATTYTAATAMSFYRVTLTAIATYDTRAVVGTPVGTTGTVSFDVPTTAPAITTQPGNVTVTAGASATFSVGASGTAPLSYQWYKGVVAITGATGASYIIATTVAGDAGSYSVVVTNTAGSATSGGATLTVNAAAVAPSITTQPGNVTVTAGASATFSVGASGTAPLSYQWYKGVVAITGATSASYIIATTVAGDAGSYSVVVTNTAGSATSGGATLTVNAATVAPSITTQPGNVTVTAGASATFSVGASGTAPLSYQWYKGVVAITGATSGSYTIAAAVAGDAGSYSVVVTNTAGSATSGGATLTVNAAAVAPSITTQPGNVTVTAGASATFSVGASGTAPLSYQWYKGVVAITGATSASYIIATTVAGDAGSYSVVVTNTAGSATSAAVELTVVSATHAVFGHGYAAGGTVTLTMNATFTGAPTRLSWQVLLPAGWTYASGTATGTATAPTVGAGEFAEWVWTTVPGSPVTFQCTFNVPTGTVGAVALSAVLAGRRGDGTTWQVLAQPEPLAVSAAPLVHSADSNRDGSIGLVELTRVIELYNTRNGSVRTGKYRVETGTEDGFAPGP